MAISLYFRNVLTRLRDRNDFATQVSVLASDASLQLDQLAATLERYTDREKGLAPKLENPKMLFTELDLRFEALCNKIGELQAVSAQRAKR
ncbi:hypothetical protein [Hydrogenophaga sp. ANAO-22]|uniref:hypothetical protein n=1 Tax=Hydrogenophaga sp. ANAO-22 TaxID=3166645 RepID=UPI0036D2FFA2